MKIIIKNILLFIIDNPKIILLVFFIILIIYSIKVYFRTLEESHENDNQINKKIKELNKEDKKVFYGTLTTVSKPALFSFQNNEFTNYFYETKEAYISIDNVIFFKNSVESFREENK